MPIKNEKDSCELAIKKTLAYRSIFKYPLSLSQLKTFLVTRKEFKNKLITQSIDHLVARGYAKKEGNKFYLPGVNTIDWKKATEQTKRLIHRNMKVLQIVGQIPWVRMISLTGSVSAFNADQEADLDALFVVSKNRLWLTRGFVTLVLKILGKFPKIDGEKGKICPNIFIDEKDLTWPKQKQNIHIAHDIVMMQPVINKGTTYFNFISANRWIFKYFANFKISFPKEVKKPVYRSFLINALEDLAMKIQLKHMEKKKTTEVTTKHLIHFNKNDNSSRIMEAYNKILSNRRIS